MFASPLELDSMFKILWIDLYNAGCDMQIGIYQARDSTWVGWNSFLMSGEIAHLLTLFRL